MSLVVRYIGVSEAMAVDGRQAFTLTNFDPSHLTFENFPVTWPLSLVAIFEGSDPTDHIQIGVPFTGNAAVFSPTGQAILSMPVAGITQQRPFADLPTRFVLAMGGMLNFHEPGDYRMEMSVTIEGETVSADRLIHVRQKVATPPTINL